VTSLVRALREGSTEQRSSWPILPFDDWVSSFGFDNLFATFTRGTQFGNQEIPDHSFAGLVRSMYKSNGIVFACELVRLMHFSEARFQFQRMRNGRPQDMFGNADLNILEQPWRNGTTSDLLTRMLVHADFGGNAYIWRKSPTELKLLRPDWMGIVIGSNSDDEIQPWDVDAELLGYYYQPGGPASGSDPVVFLPDEIAHFAPIPDPEAQYRGMSWLHPIVQEVLGDKAATQHKLKFFENGATPNMIVKLDVQPEDFDKWIKIYKEKYEGSPNAYKTLFLGAGVDTEVVGSNFQQIDFKQTVGVSETRVAAAAGVPVVVVGLSEGLQGSSLNAGNYGQARRRMADGTIRPLWRNAAGSLQTIITTPPDARLWYDDRDVTFLKDDAKDAADVLAVQATAIKTLTDGGYDPESVVKAVTSGDLTLLEHTGVFSVQLQPPGTPIPADDRSQPPGGNS
jgi:phage portal protein BeeE